MKLTMALLVTFFSTLALAGPLNQGLSFQGQIKKTNGQPLEQTGVVFRLSVVSPGNENCVLFEEQHVADLFASHGSFNLVLGQGNKSFSGNVNPSTPISLSEVFDNSKEKQNLVSCSQGSSYLPTSSDIRKFRVSFYDGSTWTNLSAVAMTSAPYAEHSSTLEGLSKDAFIKVNDTSAAVTQSNIESVFSSTQMINDLVSLISGNSSKYVTSNNGAVSFAQAPTSSAAPVNNDQLANKQYVDTKISQIQFPAQQPVSVSDVNGLNAALSDKVSYSSYPECGTDKVAVFFSPMNSFQCSSISIAATAVASGTLSLDRIPSIPNSKLSIGTTSGTLASGDDARFNVATKLQSTNVSATSPSSGQVLTYNGSSWSPQALPAHAAQVQSDWSATSGLGQILNKPSIPAAQVNSDWTATTGLSQILNKPAFGGASLLNVGTTLGTVAAGDDSRFGSATSLRSVPVSITAPVTGQVLTYDGTNWAPTSPAAAAGADAPIGTIIAFGGATCPTSQGYVAANGAAVVQATNPTLYSVVGANLPNLQGVFLRGTGSQGSYTAGTRNQLQDDAFRSHNHISPSLSHAGGTRADSPFGQISGSGIGNAGGYYSEGTNKPWVMLTSSTGGSETRPANVAVTYCIKANSVASTQDPDERSGRANVTCTSSGPVVSSGKLLTTTASSAGTGQCSFTFAQAFSGTPTCTCSVYANSTSIRFSCQVAAISATGITIQTSNSVSGQSNELAGILCSGPR